MMKLRDSMKLSDSTLTVLKNFAGINNSILVKQVVNFVQYLLQKIFWTEADISEDFPKDVANFMYLNQFSKWIEFTSRSQFRF